jgi:hypothetical protein
MAYLEHRSSFGFAVLVMFLLLGIGGLLLPFAGMLMATDLGTTDWPVGALPPVAHRYDRLCGYHAATITMAGDRTSHRYDSRRDDRR